MKYIIICLAILGATFKASASVTYNDLKSSNVQCRIIDINPADSTATVGVYGYSRQTGWSEHKITVPFASLCIGGRMSYNDYQLYRAQGNRVASADSDSRLNHLSPGVECIVLRKPSEGTVLLRIPGVGNSFLDIEVPTYSVCPKNKISRLELIRILNSKEAKLIEHRRAPVQQAYQEEAQAAS